MSTSLGEILLLAGVAIGAVLFLRFVLPRIPLLGCSTHCGATGPPWEAEVEDYGLSLTEDSAAKHLRVGRARERLRNRREGR